MKVTIDESLCTGCGVCADDLPEVFEMDENDIAKRLMDYGFHPPTVYFPLVVSGAIMIEPTETESREVLDAFIAAMRDVARLAEDDPDQLRRAPTTTPVGRLDEGQHSRLVLGWEREAATLD